MLDKQTFEKYINAKSKVKTIDENMMFIEVSQKFLDENEVTKPAVFFRWLDCRFPQKARTQWALGLGGEIS